MDKTQLKISVVTVCYNAVDCIEETMLSVLDQTYPNIEYIVIDGGSSDGTADVIRKYADRLAYWVSEPDKGIYDAMNKGIVAATGDYINFMNAGDRFFNERVVEDVVKRNIVEDFVVGIAECKKGKNHKRTRYWMPIRKHFRFAEVKDGHAVNHQSSFIKRNILSAGYDCRYKIIADDLFFIKSVVFGGASYRPVSRIIAVYDREGISNSPEVVKEINSEREDFFDRNDPRGILDEYKDKPVSKIEKYLRYQFKRYYSQIYPRLIKMLEF